MKNLFITIAFLACCLSVQAKTLRIEYFKDSINVFIDSKSVSTENVNDFIGLEIDSVSIKECPRLAQKEKHIIKINNAIVAEMTLQESNIKNITPFTIREDNMLSAYKGKDKEALVGKILFKKPMDVSEFQSQIKIKPIYNNSDRHFIIKSESDTLRYSLEGSNRDLIDSIYIYDTNNKQLGAIKYLPDSKSGMIEIPVLIKNAGDSTIVHMVVTSSILKDRRIPIEVQSVVVNDKSWVSLNVVLGLGILSLLAIIFCLIWRKKQKNKQSKLLSTEDKNLQEADSAEKDNNDLNNDNLNNQNLDLQNDKEEYNSRVTEYLNTISRLEAQERLYKDSLDEKNRQIQDLKNRISCEEQQHQEAKAELRDTISKLNGKIRELTTSIDKNEKQLRLCREKLKSAESSAAIKDKRISELNGEKDQLTSRLKEEHSKYSDLAQRLKGISKQTHYLYLIDEALCNIEKSLPMAFGNVTDETLRHKLVDPIVIGTPGLDETGMESYKATWRAEVYDNQVRFFGKDILQLSDEEVAATLREKFIENLAMRDSFNKLVRLYLFSNVGWLNIKLVKAGFDIDAVQTLFIELKNLFDKFGVEISYPHLFIDIFDETKYRDSRRCDIFSIFEPTPEIQTMTRNKTGESLIVDLVRIGLPQSSTPTRRIPMVSLPNF